MADMATQVLVIDDEPDIRELLHVALSDEGYDVVVAANGAAALRALERARPDLILLDMRMPVMDGWEFAKRYRAHPDPHAPIVVMTAAYDAMLRCLEIDGDGCLAKPFGLDEMLAVVERYRRPEDDEERPQPPAACAP